MKSRLKRLVALLGTLAMSAAFIVTGSAGIANAASSSQEYGSPNSNWKLTRTIDPTSYQVGDTVTVKAEVQRRWITANLYAYKDLHPGV